MRMKTRRQRYSELAPILEKLCDADRATLGITDILRDRVTLEKAIGAAETIAPGRRGRQAVMR